VASVCEAFSALVRFGRGLYTIMRHWPQEFPLARLLRRDRVSREFPVAEVV